ncbi:MAG: helix-turn-helix transcriptional regulator [Luteibaculum sp.]
MPSVKNAQIRYRIIDKKIRNPYKPYPSKEDLRLACEEDLFGSEDGDRISISTIEKDLKYMKDEYEAPIYFDRFHGGYAYSDDSFSLEKIPLTEDDVSALRFAAASLLSFKDIPIFRRFELAISKIFEEVSVEKGLDDEHLIWFERSEAGLRGEKFLSQILTALKEKLSLDISYRSWSSKQLKNYRLFPLLLREFDQIWYLIAYSVTHEQIRTFELGRINELSTVNEASDHVLRDFDPKEYFDHAFGITVLNGERPEKIKLLLKGWLVNYLQERPLHKTQKIQQVGNELSLEMEVFVSPELKSKLLSFGSNVKILANSKCKIL